MPNKEIVSAVPKKAPSDRAAKADMSLILFKTCIADINGLKHVKPKFLKIVQ